MNLKPPNADRSDSASPSPGSDPALEMLLTAVEAALGELGEALRRRDLAAIEFQSQSLHRALEGAVDGFTRVARAGGGVPPALRSRLMKAGGQVAAQRESLARATVALDRAMDVLMPGGTPALYAGSNAQALSAYRN
jgi:hypothetical protein